MHRVFTGIKQLKYATGPIMPSAKSSLVHLQMFDPSNLKLFLLPSQQPRFPPHKPLPPRNPPPPPQLSSPQSPGGGHRPPPSQPLHDHGGHLNLPPLGDPKLPLPNYPGGIPLVPPMFHHLQLHLSRLPPPCLANPHIVPLKKLKEIGVKRATLGAWLASATASCSASTGPGSSSPAVLAFTGTESSRSVTGLIWRSAPV